MIRSITPLISAMSAIFLAAVVVAGEDEGHDDYPWDIDPEPIILEQTLQGDPPAPASINQLAGKTARWLGELSNEEVASVISVKAIGASSQAQYRFHPEREPQFSRSLRLEVTFSTEELLGPVVWGDRTFGTGTTSTGEPFPEPGTNIAPSVQSGTGPYSLQNTSRFAHPRREAEWIADLTGTITLDALHPQQARLVLDDTPSLDGRTIHVAGAANDRLHVDFDERGWLWLYMNERLSKRVIDMRIYNAEGQPVDGHMSDHISRYYRDMPRSHLPRRFPGRHFFPYQGEGPIHRVHLIMHADSKRFEIPFSLDRVRIPHPDNILREDDEDAIVATEHPDEGDAPAAPPLQGDLEVIIE